MAKRKAKADNSELMKFLTVARRILAAKPVMPVTELELLVAAEFDQLDIRKLSGKSRTRWQNLVDWAKATLTRQGEIRYVHRSYGGEFVRCACYLPISETEIVVDGVAYGKTITNLVNRWDVWKLVAALVD